MKYETGPIRILYDGDCPLCISKVKFLKQRDKHARLEFCDIREKGFMPEISISMETLSKQIHAVLRDGTIIQGMDVIRAAYREIGLGWLIAPTGWPLLRPFFDLLYAGVAKYRLQISRIFR